MAIDEDATKKHLSGWQKNLPLSLFLCQRIMMSSHYKREACWHVPARSLCVFSRVYVSLRDTPKIQYRLNDDEQRNHLYLLGGNISPANNELIRHSSKRHTSMLIWLLSRGDCGWREGSMGVVEHGIWCRHKGWWGLVGVVVIVGVFSGFGSSFVFCLSEPDWVYGRILGDWGYSEDSCPCFLNCWLVYLHNWTINWT